MKRLGLLLLLAGFLALGGCKLGPKFQPSSFDIPTTYRFADRSMDSTINLRWWEIFDDPVLDTLIGRSLRYNKDVLIAAARVDAARSTVGYTRADQFPSLTIAAGAARGNFNGIKQASESNNFYGYPQMAWELDFWGKYRSSTDAARADMLASEYGLRNVQMGLITTVASSYFTLLEYKTDLEIANKTLKSRQAGLTILEERYKHGVVAEIDLNQSQIQWALAAAAIPMYERGVASAENALSILMGAMPGAITTGTALFDQPVPPEIPTGIPSLLLKRRPDILQAEQSAMAANEQIGVAIAMRLPSISLTGLLGVASADLSTLTTGGMAWSASAGLLGPLFEFGKNQRRVDIARQQATEAMLQYEQTVLNAFKEVDDVLMTIETLKRELLAQEIRLKAAINAENLSWQRYDKGVTSYLEVIDSQTQSFQAQLDFSQNTQQLLSAYIALYNALGGGWLSPEEEQLYLNSGITVIDTIR